MLHQKRIRVATHASIYIYNRCVQDYCVSKASFARLHLAHTPRRRMRGDKACNLCSEYKCVLVCVKDWCVRGLHPSISIRTHFIYIYVITGGRFRTHSAPRAWCTARAATYLARHARPMHPQSAVRIIICLRAITYFVAPSALCCDVTYVRCGL